MPDSYIIRSLTPADRDQVRDLFKSAFLAQVAGASPDMITAVNEFITETLADDLADPYAHYMSHPRTHFWVADAGGVVAGMMGIDHWEGDDTIAQLRRVAVHTGHRRRGIGRTLMRHVEQWTARNGYRTIRFYTAEPLAEAIAMYESLGYRLVQKHDFGAAVGREYEKPLPVPAP